MLTLLLTPRISEDSIQMAEAAQRRGLHVLQPRSWSIPAVAADQTILYGGEFFKQLACQSLNLPLPMIDPDWLTSLPQMLLHRHIVSMQLSQARKLQGPLFVKPIQDKCFMAGVYASGMELPELSDVPVYVSEPVHFVREYRCFMQEGRYKTGSLYAVDGRPCREEDDRLGLAAQLAEQAWRPTLPVAAVVDVGLLSNGQWAVVEANSVAESALYGAHADQVLEMLAALFGHEL